MESSFLHGSFLLLVLACSVLTASIMDDSEVESITGTREPETISTTEVASGVATTVQSLRESRWYRPGGLARGGDDHDDHDDVMDYHDAHEVHHEEKAMVEGKEDYWGGYYDFLINEGSYKFWAVFQLGTAALLIYSGFAALYYAKVNPSTDDDYEDYFLRRRRSIYRPPQERTFLGLSPEAFQRILDAVAREFY
ncbi:uncharacterized protein LOC124406355 [Diprion similis]|uniref:uncharacterized protein LOC124406355 n=1 Tax=Diprion similis TaxID=362088 RepID=UPI001EF764DB|nr:uncharacterized protein LOC124406355 [Diprion similis]